MWNGQTGTFSENNVKIAEKQAMTPKQEAQLKKLGPFTLDQAREVGISHQELSILVKEEKIHRLQRGIYLPIQQRQSTLKKIGIMAKELGLTSYINKHSEAIIGSLQGQQNPKANQPEKNFPLFLKKWGLIIKTLKPFL